MKPPQKYVPDFKGNKYAFATILATILDTKARKNNYIVGKDYLYNCAKRLMGCEKVEKSAYVEFEQIHKRGTLSPIHPKIMTREESEKVLRSIMLTKMKASGECKTRTVADGSQQRGTERDEDKTSPTVSLQAILLKSIIDTKEQRFVITMDIPNAFLNSNLPHDEKVIMRLVGELAEIIVKSAL